MSFPLVEKFSFLEMQGVSFSMRWILYSQILPPYKIVTKSLTFTKISSFTRSQWLFSGEYTFVRLLVNF